MLLVELILSGESVRVLNDECSFGDGAGNGFGFANGNGIGSGHRAGRSNGSGRGCGWGVGSMGKSSNCPVKEPPIIYFVGSI